MFVAHIQLWTPFPAFYSGPLEAGGADYERGAVDQVSSADGLQSGIVPGRFLEDTMIRHDLWVVVPEVHLDIFCEA